MDEMTSRERVFFALEHKAPDRCPVDFWAEENTLRTLRAYFHVADDQAFQDIFQTDIQFVFPRYLGEGNTVLADGTWYDATGARRRMTRNRFGDYGNIIEYPLAKAETVDDLAAYTKWPDAAQNDWAHFAEDIGDLHEKRVTKLHAGGLFERAWQLRGQEQFLIDMTEAPEIPLYIMEKMCDYWCDYIARAMDAAGDKLDIVYTYDDIATQNSLMMSAAMLEKFVYPFHRRMNALIHHYGKRVLYHSCGSVVSQIDALKALPIDILNPVQPLAKGMDFEYIKARWGDSLSFHGGIDIQDLLPHGTPEQVRAGVKRAVSILGRDGGYIMASAHALQNDTPVENLNAMYDVTIR